MNEKTKDGTSRRAVLPTLENANFQGWSDKLTDYIFTQAHIPGGPDKITKVAMVNLTYFVDNAFEASDAVKACAASFKNLKFPPAPPALPSASPASSAPVATRPGAEPTAPVKRVQATGQGSQASNTANQEWFEEAQVGYAREFGAWSAAKMLYDFQVMHGIGGPASSAVVAAPPGKDLKTVIRDAVFVSWAESCYDVAIMEGQGFQPWVYKVWEAVKESLSEAVREQVGSVPTGDLMALLSKLRISVNRVEGINPIILKQQMWASKMEREGHNDVMAYISFLTLNSRRLKAVNSPLLDEDLQGMLVQGLDDKIFSEIHDNFEKQKSATFTDLCAVIEKFSSRIKVSAQLAALKHRPTTGAPVFSAIQGGEVEQFVAALHKFAESKSPPASPKKGNVRTKQALEAKQKRQVCWGFADGTCPKGASCRFGHFAPPPGSSTCTIHLGSDHTNGDCRSQQRKPARAVFAPPSQGAAPPGGPSTDIVQRLLMALQGGQREFTCVISTVYSNYVGVVMDPRYKEMVLLDSCATVPCGSNINDAVPGSVREVDKAVTGLGDVRITHEYDTYVWGLVDPQNPDANQDYLLVKGVQYTKDIPFELILARSTFVDLDCDPATRVISRAIIRPGLPKIKAVLEERFTLEGRHVVSAWSDTVTGLMVVCKKPKPQFAAVAATYNGQFLESAEVDAVPLPKRSPPLLDPEPECAEVLATRTASLPRRADLATTRNIDDLAAMHSNLNHAAGFRTCGKLLRVPVPDAMKCLICNYANPRRDQRLFRETYRWTHRSQAFAADYVPVPLTSFEGFNGYFVIIELFTLFMFFFPVIDQTYWCAIWEGFVTMVEAHERSERAVQMLCSDQAMCFDRCSRCAKFNSSKGISVRFSAVENQWGNPAEGGGRHPKKVMGILMVSSGFDQQRPRLWPEAGFAATKSTNYLPSVSGTIAAAHGASRYDKWHGVVTSVEAWLIRQIPFGSLMTSMDLTKEIAAAGFGPKSTIGAFLYHVEELQSNRILDIEGNKIIHRAAHTCQSYPGVFPERKNTLLSDLLGQAPIRPSTTPAVLPKQSAAQGQGVVGGAPPPRMSARPWQPSQQALQNIANSSPGPGPRVLRPDVGAVLGFVQQPIPQVSQFQFRNSTHKALRKFVESRVIIDDVSLPIAPPKTPQMPEDPTLQPRLEFLFTVACSEKFLTPAQLQGRLPSNIWEALSGPDGHIWRANLEEHNEMLKRNRCFGPAQTEKPQGVRIFEVPLLFKIKTTADEVMSDAIPAKILKVRTLVRGDRFKKDVHYDTRFVSSKHVRPESMKIIMTHAVMHGKIPAHGDVPHAYYGTRMFPRGIWIRHPDGYDPDSRELRQRQSPAQYSELLGTLPGCPQGGYLFEKRLIDKLHAIGFTSDPSDERMMRRQLVWQEIPDYIGVFVDDVGMGTDIDWRAATALESTGEFGIGGEFPGFKIKPMTAFLGMDVEVTFTRYERSIFFSNRRLLTDFMESIGMDDRHSAKTPQVPGKEISKKDCPTPEQAAAMAARGLHRCDFQSKLMVTNYAAVNTRFDAKKSVRDLATVMNNPGEVHFVALDHFLRWIKGTLNNGVEFVHTPASPETPQIDEYSDSSHGDCPDTLGSTQGGVVYVNQTPVCAVSKVSKAALASINVSEFFAKTLSATSKDNEDYDPRARIEVSDFMALTGAAHSALWLQRFLQWVFAKPIIVRSFTDNSGVITILKGRIAWEASKTILHKIEVARAALKDMDTVCEHVDSADNPANSLTKQVASAEISRAELLHLSAPLGKSPRLKYGTSAQEFLPKNQVIYSNKAPPNYMLAAVAALKDQGVKEIVIEQTHNPPGFPFAFPMLYVQPTTRMNRDEADSLLTRLQQLIDFRRQVENYDADAVLDEITREIAEARARAALSAGGRPEIWSPLMQLPEAIPPPPPSVPRGPELSNSIMWASLTPILRLIRDGDLDNPTEQAARLWLQSLNAIKNEEAEFSRLLAEKGLCPETLVAGPKRAEFDRFLPRGASDWKARGAFGCSTCLIPAQPGLVHYIQHVLGKQHKVILERLVLYVTSFAYPAAVVERGRLCKICLKVTYRSPDEHERSNRHKVSMRAWPPPPPLDDERMA